MWYLYFQYLLALKHLYIRNYIELYRNYLEIIHDIIIPVTQIIIHIIYTICNFAGCWSSKTSQTSRKTSNAIHALFPPGMG